MATAEKIRNVGPKSAAWLRQVGVRTIDDLRQVGVVETFMKVKRAGFRPSLNLLYAMQGALDDCHWADLPDDTKAALVLAAESAEQVNPIKSRWDKAAARSATRDGDATPSDGESDGESHREDADSEGYGESESERGTINGAGEYD